MSSISGRVLWVIEDRYMVGAIYYVSIDPVVYPNCRINELNSGGIILGYRQQLGDRFSISAFTSFEGGGPQLTVDGLGTEINMLINRFQLETSYTFLDRFNLSFSVSRNLCTDVSANSLFGKADFTGTSIIIGIGVYF